MAIVRGGRRGKIFDTKWYLPSIDCGGAQPARWGRARCIRTRSWRLCSNRQAGPRFSPTEHVRLWLAVLSVLELPRLPHIQK